MDSNRRPFRDSLIIGFAMFAVFFGAGNLIFPPQIGFAAGDQWAAALAGLSLTGMLLPVLGVIAVGIGGGGFERLSRPIAPWFGTLLIFTTMIAIAWLITIPRTASVAFETGIMTLAPSLDPKIGIAVFVPLYFLASLYFAIDQNQVIDKVGRILTPALLILLVAIVIWAIVDPLGTPATTTEAAPFYLGFTTGYQTGDVFTGLLFGVIFLEAIRNRGYREGHGFTRVLLGISAVTFVGLFVVYGGLEYLGATGSGLYQAGISPAELLARLVSDLAGRTGAIALAVAVLLACLTTAVGATAVMAEYMTRWSKGRLSYSTAVIITTVVAGAQSFGGVNYIISIAGPIFMLFYPVGICIVILGLFSRWFSNDGVWKGTALMAVLIGAYDCANILSGMLGFTMPASLVQAYQAIPFAATGFAWVVPSILGGVVGGLAWRAIGRSSTGNQPEELEAVA
ncbi:LIVCS family branched-chain amino acid:cation transporter [Mycoplana sp. BE70]|uniref:branched-chain amino acid transport system II carrier protein n=1 Tax=Mycoplana sp. BE70 TaxID=2817775 RepID=UPI00286559B5|nr:branched-chain amino acid transport system II carrier protein [Mycoplana sp. BE70]MDR6759200.1 LIVCS family branched-chain amino acid:cation transporter [Mycoplana sp. BE70]